MIRSSWILMDLNCTDSGNLWPLYTSISGYFEVKLKVVLVTTYPKQMQIVNSCIYQIYEDISYELRNP